MLSLCLTCAVCPCEICSNKYGLRFMGCLSSYLYGGYVGHYVTLYGVDDDGFFSSSLCLQKCCCHTGFGVYMFSPGPQIA